MSERERGACAEHVVVKDCIVSGNGLGVRCGRNVGRSGSDMGRVINWRDGSLEPALGGWVGPAGELGCIGAST